ncbi:MAG TPA: creatininase family protein, partial [Cyclobacteriaceae bacterium]|nr:creatininase family protein [Cyclobacteriaceae bacterium]
MKPRPYILAENSWKTIKSSSFDLAVLPWGATEAHNYHLPYGTDIVEAEEIAAESARLAWEKGAKVIVLPAVPFGVNTGQHDILLDMNMNPSTQLTVLHDVVQVLSRQGVHKLVILNSHGGNDFKPMIRELGLQFQSMFICSCDWFRSVDQKLFFENKDDHAGEMESSIMMYLRPDWVDINEAGDGAAKKFKFEAIREGWAWAERQWSKVTRDTGVGDPRKATAEKGEKYFKAVTEKVGNFFFDLA